MTVLRLVHGTAALVAAGSLAVTLWTGLADRGDALAFAVLITVGELTRWSDAQGRQAAPLGAAGSLSYALLGADAGRPSQHGAAQVVTVVLVAALLGAVPHIWRGRGGTADHLARRVLTVGFAAVCFQPLYNEGAFASWSGPAYALLLLTLLALTSLCGAVLAAALAHCRTGWPFGPRLREELRGLRGIGSAVVATGAVIALASAVVGLWALPVFCLPMLLVQLSVRRYAAVRATYRQTIASLARATEIAGCTPAGHARRVAALSLAVGRDLGLTGPELTVLEYAALMHDIGQLSLVDPVPAGATAALPAAEQRRIALLGGAVVRQTGVDAEVAVVVERQADPYPEQPLAARVVRAVNAYDEMTRDAGPEGPLRALEELRLGTAGDYAPEVVESLARVLARPRGARERVPVRRTELSDPVPGWVTHG
ncbi:metal-dependent phosphohydrolase [Streptomyces sp. SID486]|uniref:HD-GYP domain-containing protein n=1 Tax=unclassified Streptomyces TaxID=2593676 RepID=UPI0013703D5B|nr:MULTISPECIES: HD domain-containing protein [unclassified Streptomyces]MYW14839.1 metal-dependent phosphohydrolase [Streptomyces sp. SID2955]MYW45266.1 metal-dependent phosphohydrolase [Streptomyces sp. SID161]MYX94986.1 metal-dependent phosphohydrolase [Streptomyces sp. SID486]